MSARDAVATIDKLHRMVARQHEYLLCNKRWRSAIENGTSTEQTIGYESTPIISMAWSRRGLATATTAELRIWNPNDWTFMEFSNFNALLIAVSWDSSGDLLACARQHEDGLVFWEDELVDKIPRWDVGFGSGIEVRCVAQATRSNLFAAGLSSDEIVLLTFHAWGGKGTLEGHTGDICSVGISPDGRFVASKSLDNTLRLWCAVG
jgi:WD40 repeat protein